MGWLFQDQKLRRETPAQYFERIYTHDGDTSKLTVIASATVRQTVYMAVHKQDKDTGRSYVFAAVILFKNSGREGFGYKGMDEGMGPCEVDCPERIMRLLSPVADLDAERHSVSWRTRVAAHRTAQDETRATIARLKPGDTIRLATPAFFPTLDIKTDRFTVLRLHKGSPIFAPTEQPGYAVRLRRATLVGARVERSANSTTPDGTP